MQKVTLLWTVMGCLGLGLGATGCGSDLVAKDEEGKGLVMTVQNKTVNVAETIFSAQQSDQVIDIAVSAGTNLCALAAARSYPEGALAVIELKAFDGSTEVSVTPGSYPIDGNQRYTTGGYATISPTGGPDDRVVLQGSLTLNALESSRSLSATVNLKSADGSASLVGTLNPTLCILP